MARSAIMSVRITGNSDDAVKAFSKVTGKAAAFAHQRAAYACGVIDPLALRAADQLYKSLAVACGDRKYFSSTLGSKMSISDKVDAFPVLRNAVEA